MENDFILDLDNEKYHGMTEWLSKSGADLIDRAPRLYYERVILGNKPDPTKALIDGKKAHSYILEPEKLPDRYILLPDDFSPYTKEGKERIRKIQEAQLEPIKREEHEVFQGMADAVRNHPLVGPIIHTAIIEASIFWRDFTTGVKCKCRPDIMSFDLKLLADVKTASDASLNGFRKSIANFRYHCQAAHYLSGARTVSADFDTFLFIAVEKTPPYLVAVYELDPEGLKRGYDQITLNYRKYQSCLETNEWPGYGEDVYLIDVPSWG
jgi:exodeoxyribonuclease VIII